MEQSKVYITEHPDYDGCLHFIREGGELTLFLHLDVYRFSKTVLKDIREDLEVVLDMAASYDIPSVAFAVPKSVGTKFHHMVRPLSYEIEEEDRVIGGWYTE